MKLLTKKKVDEILKRIAANEIIAIETPMDIDKHNYMIENNADIAYMIGGINGMTKVQNTIKRRYGERCNMQEFIEKLIARLEKESYTATMLTETVRYLNLQRTKDTIKELAEEYKPCNKPSCKDCEVYDKEKHYCPKWCDVIKHTTSELAEEYKDNVMINGQYCWQTCGATEHCKECNRLCNGSIDYYENYDFMTEEHNNGWIFCSERLPKQNEEILATILVKGKPMVLITNYDHTWLDDGLSKLIAWKPLPAPYQPKE